MKKLTKIVTLLLFLFFSTSIVFSQNTNSVQVEAYTVNEEEDRMEISIKTTEQFIVGANRYVLHISGKYFLLNIHPEGRLDEIIFYVPLDEFKTLKNNGDIVLVYGLYQENIEQDNEGSETNGFLGKHWKLGKFSH